MGIVRTPTRLGVVGLIGLVIGCGQTPPAAEPVAARYAVQQEKAPTVAPTRLQACVWGCAISRRSYDMTCYRRCCRIFGSRYARFSLGACTREVNTGGGR